MDDPRTPEIVAQVLAGNVDAFGALVERHQLPVRAFMAARLADRHEAEDLAQEVFVIAYQKLAEYDPSRPLGAWLRGIAANVLRNHLRRRHETAPGELEGILEARAAQIEEDRGGAPLVLALRQCLEGLAPHARELVERRYAHGQSLADLGRALAKQHSALTMALHRIRQQLKDCVERRLGSLGGRA